MSTEPPTLQAVLDALANFHRAFGVAPGVCGTILQAPGDEAERRWRLALDLMVHRGVHPGPLNEIPQAPSNDTLDTIDAWLVGRRRLTSREDPRPIPTHMLSEVVDYIRAVRAKQS